MTDLHPQHSISLYSFAYLLREISSTETKTRTSVMSYLYYFAYASFAGVATVRLCVLLVAMLYVTL